MHSHRLTKYGRCSPYTVNTNAQRIGLVPVEPWPENEIANGLRELADLCVCLVDGKQSGGGVYEAHWLPLNGLMDNNGSSLLVNANQGLPHTAEDIPQGALELEYANVQELDAS